MNENKFKEESFEDLKINCKKCFGFCCVALYFSASDGFPNNKSAGKPCLNLQSNFSCSIHKDLRKKGLKGCTTYDCFGAGQKVAQITYAGYNWKENPELSDKMFDVFLIMRQLHEMLWYLKQALIIQTNENIKNRINNLITETEDITRSTPDYLMSLDIESHRDGVNALLRQTSEFIRTKILDGKKTNFKRKKTIAGRLDCIGADLKKINLKGADLRGSFLIAADLRGTDLSYADLIGADLRDADIRGANLKDSLFITQSQINSAKGDHSTRLPKPIVRPASWEDNTY
ncbi:pentapeptide repeat-containing protein [Clostridium beijerinckii]|uniref:pentapeptide repeat-containing protein n=1 Tax=Clostridium beijerinckii TaxID=1520 RepID=UPI00055C81A2|nr:pentapeptide repeat-containing protein [Clostridium beijerinckii]